MGACRACIATFVYWEQGVKKPYGGFLVTAQVIEPNTPRAAGYRADGAPYGSKRDILDTLQA